MPGGFFGVDIFFVISGFLITGIIISELHRTGRFSIVGFYERRARRIMPALFLVMIVTTLVACFILFPAQWATYLGSLVSMTYFGSNYYFLGKSGYFDPNVELNPMLHTWSLAIEEQFYVFFPLILWLLWKTLKERNWALVLGAIALGSLLWANHAAINTPDPAFYLLQFRAWELLAGALAAVALSKRERAYSNQWLSGLGLAMIIGSVFFIPAGLPHPGFITLIPVLGAVLVVLTAGEGTLVNRLLSMRFFVGIGLISYSAYLWHQPMFALFRVTSPSEPSPWAFLPFIALTLGLAALSWKFVENPFRDRKRFGRRSIFIGTAILLVGTIVVAWGGTRQTFQDHRISFSGQTFGDVEDRLARNYGLGEECDAFEPEAPECRTGENPTVLLWGDSYARQLGLALKNSPSKIPFIQQTLSGCAPILGLASQSDRNGAEFARSCIKFNDDMFAWLSEHKEIKTVILGSPWTAAVPEQQSAGRDYVSRSTGKLGYQLMEETFTKIKALGVNVVATYGTPINGKDGGQCIIATISSGGDMKACNWPLKDNLRASFNEYISPLEKIVPFWHWEPIICPDGECLVTQGDMFVYLDAGHITKEATIAFGKKYDFMGTMVELAKTGPTK
jgi:peptidoglycan/LPS O-acetylase OafA/YrhL